MARNRLKRGIVITEFIEKEPRFYEAMHFIRSPMTGDEVAAMNLKIQQARFVSDDEAVKVHNTEICKRIKWWSETADDEKSMCPITPENLGAMPPFLYKRLVKIVEGEQVGDFPVKGSDEEKRFHEVQKKAEAANQSPGAALEEFILGN